MTFILQLNDFTLQSQLLHALKHTRQSITHISKRLVAVVETDDAPWLDIFHHTSGALLGRECKRVITREDVPHDNLISLSHGTHLRRCDMGIGRTKQLRMQQACRQIDIFDIAFERHTPPFLMRVGVVAHLVALIQNALI